MVSRKVADLTGQRFSKLVVTGRDEFNTTTSIKWICLCDCGNTTSVSRSNLKDGRVKSCGCYHISQLKAWHKAKANKANPRSTKSLTYRSWYLMIYRCYASSGEKWDNYGGRGIAVCDEWRYDFDRFVADMGERPSKEYSLERKNNNGNYCSTNCVWATKKEQERNKRSNRLITYNNKTQCLAAWAEELGIPSRSFYNKVSVQGLSIEQVLATKDQKTVSRKCKLSIQEIVVLRDKGKTFREIAAIAGVSRETIRREEKRASVTV